MLSWTVEDLGDVAVFRLAGKIVADNDIDLAGAVAAQEGGQRLVLDLAEVRAVDAAGLGTLVAVQSWARTTGRQLKLMNLSPRIEELLTLTKLDAVFEVCSVSEMLDLICGAAKPSFVTAAAGQGSVKISPGSEAA